MNEQESYEDRMKRWTAILSNKIDLDLDDIYDEMDKLVSDVVISDEFKSDLVDYNIQIVLTRLQYEASCRFSERRQMRQN